MADIKTTLNNIVSHWELEETSGTRVDSHGSNDLTDNNTVLSGAGIQGTAADLELSNSEYLSIADNASLSITGDISISLWIKLEQLPSTAGTVFELVSKFDTGKRSYQLLLLSDDTLRFTYFADEVPNFTRIVSSSAFVVSGDIGNWVHIVATADVSLGVTGMTIYKNGSSVADTDSSNLATSIQDSTASFAIGAEFSSGSPVNFFDGLIDEVTITSDVITSGEVTTIYNSGSGIPYSSPVSFIPQVIII